MGLKVKSLNNAGVGLVGVVVSIGVLGICSYLLMTSYQTIFATKARINDQMSVFLFRSRVMGVLGSQDGMAQTIANNPQMACLSDKTGGGCQAYRNSTINIKLVDADGTVLTDPTNANLGFKTDGSICSSFNSTSGNDACPFRFNVTWKPLCDTSDASTCYNPQNEVKAAFVFKGQSLNLNTDVSSQKMDFTIYPSSTINNAQTSCTAFGGTFNSDGSCTLPMYSQAACPQGYIVKNLNNNGTTFTCAPLLTGSCPPGQAIYGVDANNAIVCKSIYPCPPKTKFSTWQPSAAVSGDGGDGGDGGSDGCDGQDGTDGCT